MITLSEAETKDFGRTLALKLNDGDIVALHGDLGAGKTILVKGKMQLGKMKLKDTQLHRKIRVDYC